MPVNLVKELPGENGRRSPLSVQRSLHYSRLRQSNLEIDSEKEFPHLPSSKCKPYKETNSKGKIKTNISSIYMYHILFRP